MENGFFGKLFDLDNSGYLDIGEQFLDFMAFVDSMESDKEDRDSDDEEES